MYASADAKVYIEFLITGHWYYLLNFKFVITVISMNLASIFLCVIIIIISQTWQADFYGILWGMVAVFKILSLIWIVIFRLLWKWPVIFLMVNEMHHGLIFQSPAGACWQQGWWHRLKQALFRWWMLWLLREVQWISQRTFVSGFQSII